MASPAKRRKTNKADPAASKSVRSLDFFFNKQKESTAPTTQGLSTAPTSTNEEEEGETDEALARRLQEEWNKADEPVPDVKREYGDEDSNESTDKIIEQPLVDGAQEAEPAKEEQLTIKEEVSEVSTTPVPPHLPIKNTLGLQTASAAEDTITYAIPLDQSPLTFDPAAYLPQLRAQWASEGGSATYALLTHAFVLVGSTTSRIKTVDTLVNLLRLLIEGDPSSLLPAVWLATNSISPPYIDLELGLGGSAISKALKKVCGLDPAGLRMLYNKYGDAGDVAFEAKKRQSMTLKKPKPLSIKSVFDSLVKIAGSKGQGSVEAKQRIVERLIQDARGAEESRYIVRTLVQHLRIGAVKTTMLIALSRAFLLAKPEDASFETTSVKYLASLKKEQFAEIYSRNEEIVKACFARRPNYNDLVPTLLEIGVCDELLLRCGLAMHIPLRPMLGNITRDLGEMLIKLQGRDFSCEYKYDGQRAQVHCDERGKVTIFSRHLEVMTDKYPDLVALVPKIRGEGVNSFILEGEVVAVDRENGDLKTFQALSNRARKDVAIGSVTIDVCLFAFDLMYLNGEQLLDRSFRERRNLLRSLFIEIPHTFTWVKSFDATSGEADAVLEFFKSATDIKCEGIMVKVLDNLPNPDLLQPGEAVTAIGEDSTPLDPPPPPPPIPPPTPSKRKSRTTKATSSTQDPTTTEKATTGRRKALVATYEPDKRVDSWLKVKKDYSLTTDTLDLIPIGGWHGQGRKSAWWSPILLAVRNPSTGALEAVTKCISGFTDAFYKANKEKYDEGSDNVISRPSYVDYAGEPQVWFEPQEVWEISFADVTLSPTYTAAIGLVNERGLSIRFPRFLKVREDKGIEEASTDEFLAALYRKQEARVKAEVEGGTGKGKKGGEDGMEDEE